MGGDAVSAVGVVAGTFALGGVLAELVWRRRHRRPRLRDCPLCAGTGTRLVGQWLIGCDACDGFGQVWS